MTDKEKIAILAEALMPFAAMYRIGDKAEDRNNVVCERGCCEDKTMILEGQFYFAMLSLRCLGIPMTVYVPPLELNELWKKGKKTINRKDKHGRKRQA